jgi:hypothetical protein
MKKEATQKNAKILIKNRPPMKKEATQKMQRGLS